MKPVLENSTIWKRLGAKNMSKQKRDSTAYIEGCISIDYRWTVGIAGERFFQELKDHCRIMGTRCNQCSRIMVPPRIFCEECFVDDVEWVEVEPKGKLVTFGESYFSTDGKRLDKPWMLGIVRLEGSDGGLIHFIDEISPDDVKIGMSLEAVFKDERQGNILDITHFRPTKD